MKRQELGVGNWDLGLLDFPRILLPKSQFLFRVEQ
jgi:hypothetical protein